MPQPQNEIDIILDTINDVILNFVPEKELQIHAENGSETQCDMEIINLIQDAILGIKSIGNNCNISRIFEYLKEQMPNNEKITNMTEDRLIQQLEFAVNDGILSRKISKNFSKLSNSSKLNSTSLQRVYKLPIGNFSIKNDSIQSKQLNGLLQILMRALSTLNSQYISTKSNEKEFLEQIEASQKTANSSSLSKICDFLNDTHNFELDIKKTEEIQGLSDENSKKDDITKKEILPYLSECVSYLLRKNADKIFIPINSQNGNFRDKEFTTFKLNEVYIHEKLLNKKIRSKSTDKIENSSQVLPIKSESLNLKVSTTKKVALPTKKCTNSNIEEKIEKKKIIPNSCPASDIDADIIFKVLNIKPPYTPEQIIDIETIKKPTIAEYHRQHKNCSFCVRPENSNPLGHSDKFLICVDCGVRTHSYCLKYGSSLIEHIQAYSLKWQCFECKVCSVCLQTSDNMLLCDKCDRSYHKECCVPKFNIQPKGDFTCHVCKEIHLKEQKLLINSKKPVRANKKLLKNEEIANDSSTSTLSNNIKNPKKVTNGKKRKLSVTILKFLLLSHNKLA